MREESEFDRTGVYLLTGPDPEMEGELRAYIGRADALRKRLDDHAKHRDWWDTCIAFTTTDNSLTLTHIQFLEAALIRRARSAGQVNLENTQIPVVPRLGRADTEDLGRFLDSVLLLSGMAGLSLFEIADSAATSTVDDVSAEADTEWAFRGIVFHYAGTGPYVATASYDAHRRFTVHAGSQARDGETNSCPAKVKAIRSKLREEGVLVPDGDHLKFTADHVFNSPSLAAAVVYGGAANGRTAWQDKDGRSINDLDEPPE